MKGTRIRPTHSATPPEPTATQDRKMEDRVRLCLTESRLRGWVSELHIRCDAGAVHFQGRLPSFHCKQLLQTLVKEIPGVQQIHNDVEVMSIPPSQHGDGAAS